MRYGSSTVSGFASTVTSAPASKGKAARNDRMIRSIVSGRSVVGVPPPMNRETNDRSDQSEVHSSASRSSALT